ncbi:alpha/beta-hydrolase [Lactarius indigo]|nr:alpha/beta-hydrolase [Lactarius indigo]
MLASVVLALLLPSATSAAPLGLEKRSGNDQDMIPVSAQEISSKLVRPARFAQIAYCPSDLLQTWECGNSCQAAGLGGFTPLTVGGDGGKIPHFFVGHDNQTESIVVAHQGTDPTKLHSILNVVRVFQEGLNTTLFPKAGDVKVHEGFACTQGRTADTILSTVKLGLQNTMFRNVLVTGHSLGAAVAILDALMLRQHLDPTISISTIVFAPPRGGDQAFADLIDSELGSKYTYVTHGNDPVPNLPPRFIGYRHSAGEVHIPRSGEAGTVVCPGQENENCQAGNSIIHMSIMDHEGQYFSGARMGRQYCPLGGA